MNQSKHYTAKDIERYHSGQLSAAEMHALEKAALDDPFLADALEGYTQTSTPAADLSALQQKLQLRIERDKKKGLFYIGNNWMRIAALFILFAGGGWLVFQTFSKNKGTDIATVETLNKKQSPVPIQPTDSANSMVAVPESGQTLTMQDKSVDKTPAANDVAINRRRLPARDNVGAVAAAPAEAEIVSDEKRNSLQEVMLKKEARSTDSMANLYAKRNTMAKDQARGFVAADTIRNADVVMKATEVAPDETIVMKNKSVSPQARQRMNIVVDTLEPAEGWTNFDDYIANNLRTPEEFKTKPVRGEVELSFEVNKQGEPVNITVVKSLCEKCDEEAVRLLKQGPKWKNNKKRGKIKIKF